MRVSQNLAKLAGAGGGGRRAYEISGIEGGENWDLNGVGVAKEG